MDWMMIKTTLRRVDWSMQAAICALLAVGLCFIYSASYRGEDFPVASFYQRQIVWVILGFFVYYVLLLIGYHRLNHFSWWIYGASIVLLVLVLLFGKKVYGAHRWLSLFGFQIQPSELAKLATLVALAHFFSRPGRDPRQRKCLFQVGILVGLPFVLILKQPDLGTAAILFPVAFFISFAALVPLKRLGILLIAVVLLLPVGWFGLDAYQKNRLLVFFDPARDPLGAGWNKMQSEIAVGSGGLTGKGFLKGTQNVLGFLPRTVAPTDFVFSVIAEEMGFVGSALVMSLYSAVLISTMRAALLARDKLGRLLCVGMAVMLFCHVFINIAMTVGFMPITGLPLPLISYGGSFTITTMAGLGLVQSVYSRRYQR